MDNPDAVMSLLETWRKRVRMNQRVHYSRAAELEWHHRWIGITAILLSTIVGTSSLLALLKENVAFWAKLAVGFISYATAVFAGLQTFFKYSERAAQHHAVAASYGAIHRTIEKAQAIQPASMEEAKHLIDELQKQMDDLPKQAPAIPDRLWLNTRPELTPERQTDVQAD